MTGSATPKLVTFVLIAGLALLGGVTLGRPELVALAAPVVMSVVLGLGRTHLPASIATVETDVDRCIEGDVVEATVTLNSFETPVEIEVATGISPGLLAEPTARSATFIVGDGDRRIAIVPLQAIHWGVQTVGPIGLRVHGPGRFITFEGVVDGRQTVKVFPMYERLMQGLPPADTQMHSGDHVARALADGIEFATVRPFAYGDSVRRVNWRVTSRTQKLHVNLAHPERNSDVVLFLDTFTDAELSTGSTLDITVRGASAVAQHHLRHHDRVGLVSFGGNARWLTAAMGRSHTYRIAEFLLDVNATFSYAWKDIKLLPHGTIPPGALVVAFSPLIDERAIRALADLGERGFPVMAVDTLSEDEVACGQGSEAEVAFRAWKLQREMQRARLGAAGVMTYSGAGGVHVALHALSFLRHSPRAPL
ncbi:MAG: DUF58 domain-containing protein [Actinobacteria bacterium]|nr:DUF58 domain-containing protein [Actinomycetota bacterium]